MRLDLEGTKNTDVDLKIFTGRKVGSHLVILLQVNWIAALQSAGHKHGAAQTTQTKTVENDA